MQYLHNHCGSIPDCFGCRDEALCPPVVLLVEVLHRRHTLITQRQMYRQTWCMHVCHFIAQLCTAQCTQSGEPMCVAHYMSAHRQWVLSCLTLPSATISFCRPIADLIKDCMAWTGEGGGEGRGGEGGRGGKRGGKGRVISIIQDTISRL